MLTDLTIRDFAIIDHLELQFPAGLIIFTGETGAGKSIIFDAIEMLTGGRADASMVRAGAQTALIEGTLSIPASLQPSIHAILEREDLLEEDHSLTIGREIRAGGRSVSRVNGRSVAVSLLRELGELLIDLHGQSEHLSLLRPAEHLPLLDRFAEIDKPLQQYTATYKQLQTVRKELTQLLKSERDAARRSEMLTFQINEIDAARLKPGEEEELRQERSRLANAEGLATLAQETLQVLDENESDSPAASDLLGRAVHAITNLQRLDASQQPMLEQIEAIFENVRELSRQLTDYLEQIEFNPKRLDQVEERLNLIQILKRKYGADIPAILAFGEQARKDLEQIEGASERIEVLRVEETRLLEQLAGHGIALSAARKAAADQLARGIQQELDDLHMQGAQFRVDFQRTADIEGLPLPDGSRVAFGSQGFEKVEFLIAPNLGEGFKPLARIASGGETSRLMLALKNVLAQADPVPTLIFDEIDQGIGGRVGGIVGQKLWRLARRHQVMCITHLPQLAAFGDQHHHVQKQVSGERTSTLVQTLDGEQRIRELALMFGEISDGTLQSAREILHSARQTAAHQSTNNTRPSSQAAAGAKA